MNSNNQHYEVNMKNTNNMKVMATTHAAAWLIFAAGCVGASQNNTTNATDALDISHYPNHATLDPTVTGLMMAILSVPLAIVGAAHLCKMSGLCQKKGTFSSHKNNGGDNSEALMKDKLNHEAGSFQAV